MTGADWVKEKVEKSVEEILKTAPEKIPWNDKEPLIPKKVIREILKRVFEKERTMKTEILKRRRYLKQQQKTKKSKNIY